MELEEDREVLVDRAETDFDVPEEKEVEVYKVPSEEALHNSVRIRDIEIQSNEMSLEEIHDLIIKFLKEREVQLYLGIPILKPLEENKQKPSPSYC